jgi:hypothetical protein
MVDRRVARLGGASGILYVILFIPAYVVGYPDAPTSTSGVQEAFDYFGDEQSTFLIFNGVLTIFSAFFFVWFLGMLHSVLRRAEGEGVGFSSVALAGGVMFVVLSWAGVAVEVSYPAASTRFVNFQPDAQLAFLTLAASSWLYHFCQIGTSVLVSTTSLIALRTGVLPGWLAWAGFVVALLALLHFVIPLLSAIVGLLWVAVVSALMLTGSVRLSTPTRRLGDRGSPTS